MTGESSARLSTTPLRRRLNILERAASRSFTTADSSTRNGDEETEPDEMQPLPSPPTSHEFIYEEEEEEEGQASSGDEPAAGAEPAAPVSEAYEVEMHPWYKPSYPVLLALAPPVGNWLTGGDHLKDALLLLLLVFYLHQLIEVPWRLYHAARPRLPPSPAAAGPPTHAAAHAAASLRALELFLLLLTEPLSWFSMTLFALLASLRPLRELVTRVAARTSTLHALVHAHSASASSSSLAQVEVEALRKQLARLEARVAAQDGALVAYVDDALAPVEKAVRRVERRVDKLRARQGVPLLKTAVGERGEKGEGSRTNTNTNTVFVPAPPKPPGLLAGWVASLSLSLSAPPPAPSPASLSASGPVQVGGIPSPKSRRAGGLEPILEEGEGEPGASARPAASTSTSTSTHPHAHAYPAAAPPAPALVYASTLELLLVLLRRCVALALWPLRALLLPVRGVLRFVVGVGAR
ncbi:hypothetical protein FB451DRAFT_1567962 [Mycena latifolia]|nr:hypothetical protein FB451DRAFT_1567962 [Mycena latifolia]